MLNKNSVHVRWPRCQRVRRVANNSGAADAHGRSVLPQAQAQVLSTAAIACLYVAQAFQPHTGQPAGIDGAPPAGMTGNLAPTTSIHFARYLASRAQRSLISFTRTRHLRRRRQSFLCVTSHKQTGTTARHRRRANHRSATNSRDRAWPCASSSLSSTRLARTIAAARHPRTHMKQHVRATDTCAGSSC